MSTIDLDLSARLAASLAVPSRIPAPAPGIYEAIPMEVYLRWDAVSNSQLQQLRRSPAHCKAYLDGGDEDTAALSLGRAIHCVILEPDAFLPRYIAASQCQATTKKFDQCSKMGSHFHASVGFRCGTHADEVPFELDAPAVLSVDEHARCLSIRSSVYADPGANALLSGEGRHELSIVWVDRETGLTCKARLDRHVTAIAGGFIADLKSTRDASPNAWMRTVEEYGYHLAAAHYLTGAQAVGLDAHHFAHIAIEKEAPFAVGNYRVIESAIEVGDELIRGLLRLFAHCKERNHWPAFSGEVVDVTLPDYAWQRAADEVKELTKRLARV